MNWFKNIKNRWLIWNITQWLTVMCTGAFICLNRGFQIISVIFGTISGIAYCIVLIFVLIDLIRNWKNVYKENLLYIILYHITQILWITTISLYRGLYYPRNQAVIEFLNKQGFNEYTVMTFEKPNVLISAGFFIMFYCLFSSIKDYIKHERL